MKQFTLIIEIMIMENSIGSLKNLVIFVHNFSYTFLIPLMCLLIFNVLLVTNFRYIQEFQTFELALMQASSFSWTRNRNLFTFIHSFICIQHNTNNASRFSVSNWTNQWSIFFSLVSILHWSLLDYFKCTDYQEYLTVYVMYNIHCFSQ